MTDKIVDLTEEKFDRIKSGLTAAQIKDPLYFTELSKSYENEDLDLTYRIVLHAFRLDNKSPSIKSRLTKVRRLKKDVDDKLTLEQIDNIIALEQNMDVNIETEDHQKGWSIKSEAIPNFFKLPFFVFVLLPWLFYALYLTFLASPVFESSSQVIIKKPDSVATMDPTMAMLTGLGVSSGKADVQLVKAYILSSDMLAYLDGELELKSHYMSDSADFFSRLGADSTVEDFTEYYRQHIIVEIDDVSSIISIKAQAFESVYAKKLNDLIIKRSEWFINNIGHKLAREQLSFINGEHDIITSKLEVAKKNLLAFQRENKLLSPEAEGTAFQEIAYSLESSISLKKAELRSLRSTMSENASQIQSAISMIKALTDQLKEEDQRISGGSGIDNIATKLAEFSDYKIDLELALQAYSSSLISLEKSRIEAYRKLQYLLTIETSTLPDDNQYPTIVYNLTLFAIILLLVFGISKILIATINELT